MGARIDGNMSSLKAFSNICTLASKFLAFAKFDDIDNGKDYEDSNIFDKMTKINSDLKMARWKWLIGKSVVVVESLRTEEIMQIPRQTSL